MNSDDEPRSRQMPPHYLTTYEEYLRTGPVHKYTEIELLHRIGILIDLSAIFERHNGLGKAKHLCAELLRTGPSEISTALTYYFQANMWSAKRSLRNRKHSNAVWAWENPELEQEIISLRMAILSSGFSLIDPFRQRQILTNLGNALNHIGRTIHALQYWRRALNIDANVPETEANIRYALYEFGRRLPDIGHRHEFVRNGYQFLKKSQESAEDVLLKQWIDGHVGNLESTFDIEYLKSPDNWKKYEDSTTKAGKDYIDWCLTNRLFLNPMNEVSTESVSVVDSLALPAYRTAVGSPPVWSRFFNQMKQEFAYARHQVYLSFQSESQMKTASIGMRYSRTPDQSIYGPKVEAAKTGFRLAYSLFDKIAYFLNDYLGLGISRYKISFKSMWYEQSQLPGISVLDARFSKWRNYHLRSLYWISKDLYERWKDPDMVSPLARGMSDLRNHIEHKAVAVLDEHLSPTQALPITEADELSLEVSFENLRLTALTCLMMAREALIYLAMAMLREEQTSRSVEGAALEFTLEALSVNDS